MKRVCILTVLLLSNVMSMAQAPSSLSPAVREFVRMDDPLVALTHVRIIDGTGAPAREDQTIIVSGGKIQALGDAAAVPVPPEAKVLERRDYTVIPGIVNNFIALFKDTSVCSVVTVIELTKRFSVLSQSTQATVELMLLTGALYLIMSYPLSLVSRRLEQRLEAA